MQLPGSIACRRKIADTPVAEYVTVRMASTSPSAKNRRASVIRAIGTAVPDASYTQEFASAFLQRLEAFSDRERRLLRMLYRNTGIDRRHTVIDDYGKAPENYTFFPKNSQLLPEPTLADRNRVFVREASKLAERAVRQMLESLHDTRAEDITHLITMSCTGFSAPGFDLDLVKTFAMREDIHRFHLGFMGCYAAFPALKLAHDITLAEPAARVLVVSVELCSLHFQQKTETDFLVANSLFADGAAAALVTSADGTPGLRLNSLASRVIPGSESDMAWTIGEHAFDMRLSSYVPKFIEENIASIVDDLLTATGGSRTDIDIWAIHPGGRAILDRSASALGIGKAALTHSYEVLREYGNMSSATILFVLKRIMEADASGSVLAAAFGPGLTVQAAHLTSETGGGGSR